ncbi:MAG: hypothetical protein H8E45_10355 [Proteobacteria bacterium]|nr:hypothetical protein [Pseudomonadota bacterium]
MARLLYTRWQAGGSVRLDADGVFQEISRFFNESADFNEALSRMLSAGFVDKGLEVTGVDALLERIDDALRELQSEVNFDHALDGQRELMRRVLESELAAADALNDSRDANRRQSLLGSVPADIDGAIERLGGYGFLDADASAIFDQLTEQLADVSRLALFIRGRGRMFKGPDSLDYERALEFLDRIEGLLDLKNLLFGRDFNAVDKQKVEKLLGEESAEDVERLAQVMQVLHEGGYIAGDEGQARLTSRGARKLGQVALREIYRELVGDIHGNHGTTRPGHGEALPGVSRPWQPDEAADLDVLASLRNTVMRSPGLPLRLHPVDLEVVERERDTRAATVLLLDMSWSMSWQGRFAAARRVAMAMETLIRTKHPQDFFAVVGFYTRAVELHPGRLPETSWNMGEPFTNLQDGLRLGREILMGRTAGSRQMIIITDGQPTAYFRSGRLFCEWPLGEGGLSSRASQETLKEVGRVTASGIRLNTFMLDDSPALRAFVEKMTAANRGRAFYMAPDQLGKFLLVDYVRRRRKIL